MSLTVTRSRVKEKLGIADSVYDTPIDNLITDFVPAIQYAVRDVHIADTGNTGLQATLTLGATEICCGEFAAQLLRAPGGGEMLKTDVLEVTPIGRSQPADPSGLAAQGWARLRPYLKPDPSLDTDVAIIVVAKEDV